MIEEMKNRVSVRTFDGQKLTKETIKILDAYISELNNSSIFGGNVRFKLVHTVNDQNEKIKLGTYGVIKGANTFVAAAVDKNPKSLIELGYKLESFVLKVTAMGLGTCWLGGTFSKGEFGKAMSIQSTEILPIVLPVGVPLGKRTIVEKMFRAVAGSDNRKQFNEIFYKFELGKPLASTELHPYFAEALDMVRIAPSGSNKQPWRIVVDNDNLNIYLAHTKGYSSALGYDIQIVDIGIAMLHLESALTEHNLNGKWVDSKLPNSENDTSYIISYVVSH